MNFKSGCQRMGGGCSASLNEPKTREEAERLLREHMEACVFKTRMPCQAILTQIGEENGEVRNNATRGGEGNMDEVQAQSRCSQEESNTQ